MEPPAVGLEDLRVAPDGEHDDLTASGLLNVSARRETDLTSPDGVAPGRRPADDGFISAESGAPADL
ncbi:hypothetical protein GCM10009835_38020 [Planosporangium flavigriseum]|uniref:Uncharacterized protein n=1 Tax=Planosporangium flavigriseum TaxID=373681 RepID=A0A8J3LP94_9ACTN|nr:hypothetical protein Pfl04_25320 [Planosporangium flavigriseum]